MNLITEFIWSCLFLPAMLICGLYLTVGCGFLQFRHFGKALKLAAGSLSKDNGQKGVSPLQAASTALASTVGTGNIVGTAQAIAMGGPGAVFWLWVTALFGMIIKYAEIFLSLAYREKDGSGGPMYYIKKGMGSRFAPLAGSYAAFAALSALGMGNMCQINSAALALSKAAEEFICTDSHSRLIIQLIFGVIAGLLLASIMKGGAKSVGRATELLVPFMSLAFIMVSAVVLICHADSILPTLKDIILCAISPKAAAGAAGGLTVREAVNWGIRRSAFSNEAGLGSAGIAHAAVETDCIEEHSLWGIFEVFADTIVICTASALCILCSGISIPWGTAAGPELLQAAFGTVFGECLSAIFMALSMLLFAIASTIGWSLYGCRCAVFLFGTAGESLYKLIFPASAVLGSIMSTDVIWNLADAANALMSLPNLIALFVLSGKLIPRCKKYFS